MNEKHQSSERLGAFSDGVFAVIITIMVLDLRPPTEPTFSALVPLWPTALSYAVSYLFIAIIWVNHHHLWRFTKTATTSLIWWNFAHLFMVSLVPFSTAWIASSDLASVPVFFYAAVFVMVNTAYRGFEREALCQASETEVSPRMRRFARTRSLTTLGIFFVAMLVALLSPYCGFGLVCCVLLIYLRPASSWIGKE